MYMTAGYSDHSLEVFTGRAITNIQTYVCVNLTKVPSAMKQPRNPVPVPFTVSDSKRTYAVRPFKATTVLKKCLWHNFLLKDLNPVVPLYTLTVSPQKGGLQRYR